MNKKVLREAHWIIPRFFLKGIALNERGVSGFGDRLRGISLALFLATFHRTRRIYYHDKPSDYFPYRMLDLISIEGFELIAHSPPFPARTLVVEHDCQHGSSLKRYGFKHLWRIRPRDQAVTDRINSLGIGDDHIGLHVRGTDALSSGRYPDGVDAPKQRMLERLKLVKHQHPTKKVFLAADSKRGIEEWREIVMQLGFELTYNDSTTWTESALRQSSAGDLLVDFFGLSKCFTIVRLVPSEFSRFATAIKTRRYTSYYRPDEI